MSLLASLATAVYNLFDNETTNKENARLHNYTVSAVIPVFNEITSLKDTVIHVLNQDYPNLRDIYLLDDRSTDGTTELCREIALNWEQERTIYHVLAPENRGKAANISALLRNPNYSLSDILWFIDSDIRAHPHQVSALVDYFDTEKVAAVTGRCWPMDPVEDKNLIKDSLMDLVNEFGHQIRTGKFDRRKLADEWEEYTSIMQP
ncbi:MAG: glycosyltransferase, partial [Candidatus Woesearchaeota archaeon]|nr:glycosyltransferase [Candidatus Woesearchaeota archaeon]